MTVSSPSVRAMVSTYRAPRSEVVMRSFVMPAAETCAGESHYSRRDCGSAAAWLDAGANLVRRNEAFAVRPVIASREFVVGFAVMAVIIVGAVVVAGGL